MNQYSQILQSQVSLSEALAMLHDIGPRSTLVLVGENGIGKTYIANQLQAMLPSYPYSYLNVPDIQVGDIAVPNVDKERNVMRMAYNERSCIGDHNHKGRDDATPIILQLDEIFKGKTWQFLTIAPMVHERRFGSLFAPEGSIIFGCSNLRIENLGDTTPAHFLNRVTIVNVAKPTADEWVDNFAMKNGLDHRIIAFVKRTPSVLQSFLEVKAGNPKEDVTKINPYIYNPDSPMVVPYASPRSLHRASNILQDAGPNVSSKGVFSLLEQTIGSACAKDLDVYLTLGAKMTDPKRVLLDPKNAPLDDNPLIQIMATYQLYNVVKDRKDAASVFTYVSRMHTDQQVLFLTTAATGEAKKLEYFVSAEFMAMCRKYNVILRNN